MEKNKVGLSKKGLVSRFVRETGVARDVGRQVIDNLGDDGCQILARVYRGDPPEEYNQALDLYGEGYSKPALVDVVLVRRITGNWPEFPSVTEIIR